MNLIESKSVVCYSKHVFVCTASFVKCSHTRQKPIQLCRPFRSCFAHLRLHQLHQNQYVFCILRIFRVRMYRSVIVVTIIQIDIRLPSMSIVYLSLYFVLDLRFAFSKCRKMAFHLSNFERDRE